MIQRRLILTAAHCVWDEAFGGWAKKRLFVPAYHRGAGPNGRWRAQAALVAPSWQAIGLDPRHDHGPWQGAP